MTPLSREEFAARARLLLTAIDEAAAEATHDPTRAPDIHTLVALLEEQVDRLDPPACTVRALSRTA